MGDGIMVPQGMLERSAVGDKLPMICLAHMVTVSCDPRIILLAVFAAFLGRSRRVSLRTNIHQVRLVLL
ncbi:hypothetical protein BDV26DRAFT_270194 [Aspergillus bertholletiae]|uniref:Uncharacterized protein n=1 Tax=Aspergillus bertholletiae TaxID=1226010 RepID=A0A5N7AWW9_9EURO|nr:hypothetical protein BDV26DRAFT_270194 [Aspergillus bertholletiae]